MAAKKKNWKNLCFKYSEVTNETSLFPDGCDARLFLFSKFSLQQQLIAFSLIKGHIFLTFVDMYDHAFLIFTLIFLFDVLLIVPPTITYRTPSPVVINESESTTLACVVRGNPFPAITWRNESGIIQRGYSWQYLTNYTIGSATKDHAGIYTCTANFNASGVGSFSTAYNVSVIVRRKLR